MAEVGAPVRKFVLEKLFAVGTMIIVALAGSHVRMCGGAGPTGQGKRKPLETKTPGAANLRG